MRLRAKLILLAAVVTAIAIAAAYLLLPLGKQAGDSADLVENELCIVAPATLYDPASGQPLHAAKSIPLDARCPICGMYPARTPHWAAQVVFQDGASHFFDSPVDLFVFLQRTDRSTARHTREDIAVSYVTDFETRQWIEAQRAFFVQGSAVLGPMRGADLPAFSTRESAREFARNRGGTVLAFEQIGPGLIRSLNRNTHHLH